MVNMYFFFMFSPFIVAIAGLLGERLRVRKLREITAVLTSLFSLTSVYMIYLAMESNPNKILIAYLHALAPLGAVFEIDRLSIFMAFSAVLLGFFTTLYSYSYMEHDTRLTEYYTLLSAMIVGMVGVAFSGDFFTLFIFWELMGLTSYVLVAFRKDRPEPIEAGLKYFVMGALGSTIIFFGMAFLYGMAGTVNFAQISTVIRGQPINVWLILVFTTFLVGFGIKTAIVPLHTWLPDAHPEAPSPISAMLSGMLIETGLYALTRVLFITFEPSVFQSTIAILSALTMTFANILAILQNDIKRMLAYSSISQIGYMLVGLSSGTVYGILGMLLHVFNHSLMKGLAFLSSGSIVHMTGTRDINRLKGVGRMMPYTTLSLFIAFLGLGGVPSTNGFVSKFILFGSSAEVGNWWLLILGVLNSAFSMGYYLRYMKTLISEPSDEVKNVKEAPKLMVLISLIMAALIILLGIWPEPVLINAERASNALINGLKIYVQEVFS